MGILFHVRLPAIKRMIVSIFVNVNVFAMWIKNIVMMMCWYVMTASQQMRMRSMV